ncbi:MAG TPA: DUF4136 domain-containing protein [Desulfobacterales bacterium]
MMRLFFFLTALAAMMLPFGCTTVQVSQDYDLQTDFSRYQDFQWVEKSRNKTGDVRIDNPLLDARIRNAVENTLKSKGFSETPRDQADFLVNYQLAVRSRLESDTYRTGVGYGYWPYWGGVGYETTVREYDEGILVIDFLDAASGELFWRGIGTRRLRQYSDPQEITREVNETVAKILAQFPPQPAK